MTAQRIIGLPQLVYTFKDWLKIKKKKKEILKNEIESGALWSK